MDKTWSLLFLVFPLLILGCLGGNEPPFPGKPPQRAVYGTPPPTVSPEAWFGDVKYWGAEVYLYHSPHYQGNLFKQQAGMATDYPGRNLKQMPFLSGIDPAFAPYTDTEEIAYLENLVLEAYEACLAQEMDFFYALPFPFFPVQEKETVRQAHPEWFGTDGKLDLTHPGLISIVKPALEALQTAMPDLSGIALIMGSGNGSIYQPVPTDLEKVEQWLQPLLQTFDEGCKKLSIQGMATTQSIWHTNKSRRETYEIFNRFPDITIIEQANWPEETTLMPFWGFLPAADTLLLKNNPTAVNILTDTEFLGQGKIPVVLPRWWQYLAQQAYLHEVDLAIGRSFQGDAGGSATNFNRLNLHLLLQFLEDPRLSLKEALHHANESMFGDDFPSRLTSIMIIAEDAIQAISSVNYINLLDDGKFPPPSFLDRDYLEPSQRMKAIDDLFEPPGTPLYPEETTQPDTLNAAIHWRWQMEVSARPVDEYLLTIENAINWLDKIQKEVEYLTLDFPPEQRQMFVQGYRDLLLLGRGMYQFVQGAAVHHRWYRLERMSEVEVQEQLKPIAAQLRLIANEADSSALQLKQRLLEMAETFETVKMTDLAK